MIARVISLERAEKRRESMTRFLSDRNIDFEFIDAIDGSEQSPTDKLHSNAVACFLSHKKAMKWVSEQTEPVLILEDDAYSFKNIEDEIEIILSSDIKWDIIMLGWINLSDTQEIDDLFLKCDRFILTHAYLINPLGAKRILKFIGEPKDHVDIRISEMGRNNIVRVLLSKEKIFHQSGLESQIPKTNKNNENKPRKILRIANTKRDY